MIYTVTFNPAIDYVVRLDRPLEVGEVNRAAGEDCVLGGKGINVSGVLRELGCESVALGFVAGETGAWLERGLAAQGLRTDFIHLAKGMTRINVKIKAGTETELNGAGPSIPESAMQQLEAQLDTLQPDDILILAGSIPKSLSQSTYERLLAGLEGHGVRAVVDATQDLLVNVLPYHPFLIKPNNHELGEIVGRELKTDAEITAAARALQEKGARNVLVSMAGNGALLVDEHGEVHRIGCPKGKVVNSVGAGDSMVAGFVAGYLQSGSYEQALRLGTACGSATAFSLGLATKEKIAERFHQEQKDGIRFLKSGIETRNAKFNEMIREFIIETILNSDIENVTELMEQSYHIPAKYSLEIYVSTIVTILTLWLKEGCVESPEELADIILEAVIIKVK